MLPTRIATAAVMLVAAFVTLFYLPWVAFAACCMFVVLLGAMEWARLASLAAWPRAVFVACCLAGSAVTVPGVLPAEVDRALLLAAVVAWAVAGVVALRRRRLPSGRLGGALAGLVLLVPAAAAVFVLYVRSPAVLLGAMAVVWISDSAAYFAGRAFGRHKLAAAISPGKTWEGVAGAMVATVAFGSMCGAFFYDLMPVIVRASAAPWAAASLLAVVMAGFGIVGDLFESLAKRIAGVKDSGRLLPGHGGILDRIDALLPALPVAALAYLT